MVGVVVLDGDGGPAATSASRFGAEAAWRDARGRGLASLAAQGSIFDGALDDRRVAASAALWSGAFSLAGHGELGVDDRLALSAASLDAGVRDARARLDVRATLGRSSPTCAWRSPGSGWSSACALLDAAAARLALGVTAGGEGHRRLPADDPPS